jgi:hypothetical protein
MNWKETYTKIFLKELGETVNDENVKFYLPVWWMNYRKKGGTGLRLTDEGYAVLEKIELETHEVLYPKDMKMTTQILLFLDNFIDCPYYLTKKAIIVTDDRRAVELTLFAGDLRRYGLAKALSRQKKVSQSG